MKPVIDNFIPYDSTWLERIRAQREKVLTPENIAAAKARKRKKTAAKRPKKPILKAETQQALKGLDQSTLDFIKQMTS